MSFNSLVKRIIVKDRMRDSAIWDSVQPRSNDILIASCYKSGTTLTQQIVNLMVYGHDHFESIHHVSPWVELCLKPPEEETGLIESLPSPRLLKTHLPFEALPYYPDWKYIYLMRDGRDVCLSLYYHCKAHLAGAYHNRVQFDNGSDNFLEFWQQWLETGEPRWPFWEHINSWWQVRRLPNVLLVHYANLINNKCHEIERIAEFLKIDIEPLQKEMILKCSSFQYMKANWQKFEPPGVFIPQRFINRGKNQCWKEFLTEEHLQHYQQVMAQKLEHDCINWLQNGGELT